MGRRKKEVLNNIVNSNIDNIENNNILNVDYSEVMKQSYIDYSMNVIIDRALPDIRDGLKPVQRRILYDMYLLHTDYDKPHRKSARIVGDTMGKFHPHGDSSIYEALVGLSQNFKKNMTLIDGHGNFGSIEGDGAAAMRYTESRLTKFSQDTFLSDLDKNIIDFQSNFDDSEKEPTILPVKIPNFLVNGAEGIAVGMTTNVPPHNLGEVINACEAYLKNENISIKDLLKYCPAPDFPTGGIIANKDDLLDIYTTGQGKIRLRGKFELEETPKSEKYNKLVITEIPYTMIGTGISGFISDVVNLIDNKILTDIVDISNETSKLGIRIVLYVKKDADINKIKNILYKKTKIEDNFGVNLLAIVNKKPEILNLKHILEEHISFQYEILKRKYTTLLQKELYNKEIKEGLIKAYDIIDLIIEILKGSKNIKIAKDCLMSGNTDKITFKTKTSLKAASKLCFTENQATAILDMRLAKLIGLEITTLNKEYKECLNKITQYEKILSSKSEQKKIILKNYEAIKKEYATSRKTILLQEAESSIDIDEKPIIPIYISINRFGYLKIYDDLTFNKNKDEINNNSKYLFKSMNNNNLCLFTDIGYMHQIKLITIPLSKIKDKGTPLDNLCDYNSKNENIMFLDTSENIISNDLLFVSNNGYVKIVPGEEFNVIRKKIASTKLADNVLISYISLINKKEINKKVLTLNTYLNKSISFLLKEVPEQKKTATGVKGISLTDDDNIKDIKLIDKSKELKIQHRGGKGILI